MQAFENLKAALASVGATFDDVVKLNNYLIDIGANLARLPLRSRDKYVNASAPPASTTIGIAGAGAARRACTKSKAVVVLAK